MAAAWAVNFVLILATCSVFYHDGRVAQVLSQQGLRLLAREIAVEGTSATVSEVRGRLMFLAAIGAAAIACIALNLYAMFFGARRHRGIRSWLGMTAIVAGWLLVLTAWPSIAWAGMRARAGGQVEAFEAIAVRLRADWPNEDGASPELGPFSAYPVGNPRVLMPLRSRPPGAAQFRAVERSASGGLRFELTGGELGSWLEWHPPGEAPRSFVGGLETQYELERSSAIGAGWFLAAYRTVGLAGRK